MKNSKILLVAFVIGFMPFVTNAQMLGTLNLPGLGGGANANAATYAGDGVYIGATGLFSSKLNGVIGAVAWNTGVNILKAKYTVAIAQPHLMDGSFQNGFFPVTVISPIQLSWDLDKTKLLFNYTFFLGHELPLNAHAFSIRATQLIKDGNYSLNGGIIYEYRKDKPEANRTLGDALVLECNFSKHFEKGHTVGVFGYYNSNVTPELINGNEVYNEKSAISGIGLDGNLVIAPWMFLNGKVIYDLTQNEVLNANKVVIGLTFKL